MWWLLGAAIWVVLLMIVIALCRVAANADRAATNAFAEIERCERQKLYTLSVERCHHAA